MLRKIIAILITIFVMSLMFYTCGSDSDSATVDKNSLITKCTEKYKNEKFDGNDDSSDVCDDILDEYEKAAEDAKVDVDYSCVNERLDKADDTKEFQDTIYEKCCDDCETPKINYCSGKTDEEITLNEDFGPKNCKLGLGTFVAKVIGGGDGGTDVNVVGYLARDKKTGNPLFVAEDDKGNFNGWFINDCTVDDENLKQRGKTIGTFRCEKGNDGKCYMMMYHKDKSKYAYFTITDTFSDDDDCCYITATSEWTEAAPGDEC